MNRRRFLERSVSLAALAILGNIGCRGTQHAHVLDQADRDMVGSHTAGAETWEPLIQQSVGQLLGTQHVVIVTSADAADPLAKKRICFAGVENKSAEEIGDFREQIYRKDRYLHQRVGGVRSHHAAVSSKLACGNADCGRTICSCPAISGCSRRRWKRWSSRSNICCSPRSRQARRTATARIISAIIYLTLELINIETGKADKEIGRASQGVSQVEDRESEALRVM